jgi:amidohydrolase
VVGAEIVNALQTLVSRENDPTLPAIVSICAFNAGEARNVIPDTALLRGTTRTVLKWQQEQVVERLQEIINNVAAAHKAEVEISFSFGAPPVVNDPAMAAIVLKAAQEVVGDRAWEGPLLTVSEDYAEYLERVPGCFYFVGSANKERGLTWGHHHPKFDVDEDALTIGVETMTRTVLHYFADQA